ncbi:MAG: hypothetical protein AAF492_09445 [Verrucomicrobiota bacterium]
MKHSLITMLLILAFAGPARATGLPFTFELDPAWKKNEQNPSEKVIIYDKGSATMRFKAVPTQQESLSWHEVDRINRLAESKASAQYIQVDGLPSIYTRVIEKKFLRKNVYRLNCRVINNKVEYFMIIDFKGSSKAFDEIEDQFIAMIKSIKWK